MVKIQNISIYFFILIGIVFEGTRAQNENKKVVDDSLEIQEESKEYRSDSYIPKYVIVRKPAQYGSFERLEEGWEPFLQLGSNFDFVDNSNSIAQKDGLTIAIGAFFNSSLDYLRNNHEWRNQLNISEQFLREPNLEKFVKNKDQLSFTTSYLYHLPSMPYWGPIVEASAKTNLFQTKDYQDSEVTYAVTSTEGTTANVTSSEYQLSDPLGVTYFDEFAGAFFQPVNLRPFTLEFRAGVVADQILAEDQYVLRDEATTTDVIEVVELRNVYSLGPMGSAFMKGQLANQPLYYAGYASLDFPFLNNKQATDNRETLDLINYEFSSIVGYQLFEYASLSYEFSAVKEPLLLEAWRSTHALLLNFSFTPIGKKG